MKHNLKIACIILAMFLVTQFIGIYVTGFYSGFGFVNGKYTENVQNNTLPFGLDSPKIEDNRDFSQAFFSIILSFIIAISLLLLLTRINAEFFLRAWFFLVIVMALGIFLNVFFPEIKYKFLVLLVFAIPLAYFKVYKKNLLIHNITELAIYPGIAAVFVPILNIYTIAGLLILISVYDIWAVWHSGIMQRMAKYQINKLNIFSGFFVPYIPKKIKMKIKKMKKSELKKKKIRVNVAILGGGDIVFPIITAGVVLKALGLFPAIFVSLGATLGLSYLLLFSEKKKFYPAMPFITLGIFLGILAGYLLF